MENPGLEQRRGKRKTTHTHTHSHKRGNGTQAVSSPPASSLLQINNQPQTLSALRRSLTAPSDRIRWALQRAQDKTQRKAEVGEPRYCCNVRCFCYFVTSPGALHTESSLETAPPFRLARHEERAWLKTLLCGVYLTNIPAAGGKRRAERATPLLGVGLLAGRLVSPTRNL